MSLSIKTKELLCDQFDFSNCSDAKHLQQHLNVELAHAFEFGGEKDAATDLWKANHYRQKAGLPLLNAGSPVFKTSNFYWLTGSYTSARLNTLRLNQLAEAVGHSFLHRLFSIAGFSYFLEIPFHIGVITYSTFFKPVTEEEAKLSYKERTKLRFVNVLTKDDRLPRLINAVLWGPLNLTAFLVAAPIAIALNIIGFTIDFSLAITFTVQKLRQLRSAIKEVSEEITNKQTELTALEAAKGRGEIIDEKNLTNLRHDINGLQHAQLDLEDKYAESKEQAVYGLAFTGAILAGIVLSFFPPTMMLGAVITAVTIVFAIPDTIKTMISYAKAAKDLAVDVCNKFMSFFKPKPTVQLGVKLNESQQPLLAESASIAPAGTSTDSSYEDYFNTLGTPQTTRVTIKPVSPVEMIAGNTDEPVPPVEMIVGKKNEDANKQTSKDSVFKLFKDSSIPNSPQYNAGSETEEKTNESWTPTSFSLTSQTVY